MKKMWLLLCMCLLVPTCNAQALEKNERPTSLKELLPLASQGNTDAQVELGFMYEHGRGVPQDHKEAMRWYRLAAEQGDAVAQFILGSAFDEQQDYKDAMRWYRLAAKQGSAGAQQSLGLMYSQGHGVRQDYKASVRWYRLVADQGYADAQQNLGLMYYQGHGVLKDYTQAHMWCNLAAAAGHANSMESRDIIAGKMTSDQIAEAQRLAREWKPKTKPVKNP